MRWPEPDMFWREGLLHNGNGMAVNVSLVSRAVGILKLQLYTVRGDSMSPSFAPGDRLLVSRTAYRGRLPSRGDVVVVRDPREAGGRYLKRIVGLPGEEVRLFEGLLLVDGGYMAEPYLRGLPACPGLGGRAWKLAGDQYFVMGDNRAHSTDSRQFGPVGPGHIVGRAWFRWWPPGRRGRVG